MRLLLLLWMLVAMPAEAAVARVDALLAAEAGLLESKVALDALVDATVDGERVSHDVEAWSRVVLAHVRAEGSVRARVDGLLRVLYVAGAWNGGRAFAYDFDDPFARAPSNRLLSTYLETRRGNCVTMPVLFAILGQRLGLTLALAKAPQHLLVKVRDDDGTWFNVEATGGGLKADASYVRDTGISAQALANATYLRPLTPTQTIATLAGDVVGALERRGELDAALALGERLHAVDPRDVDAMLRVASLHARILDRDFHARWPNPIDVPPERHAEYRMRSAANAELFARAEQLGWREPTPEAAAAYLRAIDSARAAVTRGAPSTRDASGAAPPTPPTGG
ncbi:hypothetical protein LF41_2522 [Lysobacter dokdonensis DS-58]|uniref:Protein SirB1 N-terminal domain-containing protein n=1 Tax=Lysobacter dokdonensis DS-58 TaxID=1300345 RepID=A0A0A2X2Z6_9GAMM|nr:transglutaminase family protein [Lysobacter dokdonensis]KGQ19584.1 hypothetical protein LF41_2522 [Lysobacter dokdonensis DS-58]